MTTHASRFREVILDTIHAENPGWVSLDRLYAAAQSRIIFDAEDMVPPRLHGGRVKEPSWKRNLRNTLQGMKDAGELVNATRNAWRLPTPDPATALDATTAWPQVRQAAERALHEETPLRSTQRGHRYQIIAVSEDRIMIRRLDSHAPESVSRGEVERAVVRVNAAGGRVGRRTVHYTVAKEVAIVELHPQLQWDESTDSIIAVSTSAIAPVYRDFGEAPNDDPTQLSRFARRVRAGQAKFRENLLLLYGNGCAISGWGPDEVLEAAHIDLHANGGINHSSNGILLRSDLHTLFDCGFLRIHPESLQVVLDARLRQTSYWELNGRELRPRVDGSMPNREYLWARWRSGEA
jgi:hypothetical protein